MNQDIIDAPIFGATHRGYLTIADKKIPCAVLENGKRIISQTGLFDAFDRPRKGEKRIEQLPSIVGAKNLLPFVTDELIEKSQTIYYKHTNGKRAQGYDAEVIPIICELYIDAAESGELHSSQEKLANRAMILIRALAKVGITALIDEATGYQYDRESQELQRLLETYIAKDLMKWQSRFPNQYYKEIYRLYGWEYNPSTTKRPQYIGNFTNKYVYDLFPEEVMDEIKKRNPVVKGRNTSYRRNKNFQYLTTDIGLPQLDNHISKLLGVMKLSDNINHFKRNFERAFEEELSTLEKVGETT
ncbi:hypothetical protein COF42_25315 [Bacillus wiedmannii]|uniref:P63C domain-containing protein n=1 Tax=Bacillus wiedmannii TaxID=1890302 RepID=UPI000BFD76CD|nr:P63C domain-containing protein [Bacillus wiedmannii]PHC83057.1 hypothetical protein COF42_25315 [Bacillus wiedmannii]